MSRHLQNIHYLPCFCQIHPHECNLIQLVEALRENQIFLFYLFVQFNLIWQKTKSHAISKTVSLAALTYFHSFCYTIM